MAKPIESTPSLKGKDAERFLKEKERMENLTPESREYKKLVNFGKECLNKYKEKPFFSL